MINTIYIQFIVLFYIKNLTKILSSNILWKSAHKIFIQYTNSLNIVNLKNTFLCVMFLYNTIYIDNKIRTDNILFTIICVCTKLKVSFSYFNGSQSHYTAPTWKLLRLSYFHKKLFNCRFHQQLSLRSNTKTYF